VLVGAAHAAGPFRHLKLLTSAGYLPDLPVLVRLEVLDARGERDWSVWDAEATLYSLTPGVTLSTNRLILRNGLGSVLVSFSGDGDFQLVAALDSLTASRSLQSLAGAPVVRVDGSLPGVATTWSGIVRVTNDVIVPLGHTLTLQPGTLVLLEGVTEGIVANDLSVNGTLLCLGTEEQPVTLTCAESDLRYRWGQIRHNNSQPSLYRFTTITRGGRAFGEGHTGTGPVLRPIGSRLRFENCSVTDHADTSSGSPEFGRPGKILQADLGSDITFDNCLLARARMGPEANATALLITNTHIMEMHGVNDADGLFLDPQMPGQSVRITHSVLAEGGDDGIDTLDAVFTVTHTLIRDWRNPAEDSKGISIEGGEARLIRCLLVDNALGLSGKGNDGVIVRAHLDHCTILAESYALGATNKTGTTPIIDFRVTNSIVRGRTDSIFTQYNPSDIRLFYCNTGEPWVGPGNTTADPRFVNVAAHDYRLLPQSPGIDAGDFAAPFDPDGSRTDVGWVTFLPPPPVLTNATMLPGVGFRFHLSAYPNRNYVVEFSTNLPAWSRFATVRAGAAPVELRDTNALTRPLSLFRARLAP
jgi:hypothetical protein